MDIQGWIPRWGGTTKRTGQEIKLYNTCTIDNVLARLYLHYLTCHQFKDKVKNKTKDRVCMALEKMFSGCNSQEDWNFARMFWMKEICGLPVKNNVLDSYGSDWKYAVQPLKESFLGTLAGTKVWTCTNQAGTKQEVELDVSRLEDAKRLVNHL